MRYILNSDGYIEEMSEDIFTCDGSTCTEYTGTIPTGYDTLEEWHSTETADGKLNAWKIVSGNLLFDNQKYIDLQKKYEIEALENTPILKKELMEQLYDNTEQIAKSFKEADTTQERIVSMSNSKAFPISKVTINPKENITGYVDLIVSNKNLIKNEGLEETINGVAFSVDEDGSINVNGTATANTEYSIRGTSDNTSPFFVFKKGIDYFLSSSNSTIKMYNYDGTDRTEIYSGTGGAISFTDSDKLVTQIVIYIASGTTADDTFYIQLELGTAATEYIIGKQNKLSINLDDKEFFKSGLFVSESTIIGESTIITNAVLDTLVVENKQITLTKEDETYDLGEGIIYSQDTYSIGFTLQDTILKIKYRTSILTGTFQGNVFDPNDIEMISNVGLLTNLQYTSNPNSETFALGFNGIGVKYDGSTYSARPITITTNIPNNFVVVSAYITLLFKPFAVTENSTHTWSKCENVKLYTGNDNVTFATNGYALDFYSTDDLEEITGAFGTNGWTSATATDNEHETQITQTINIKDNLESGSHLLYIQSDYTIPSSSSSANIIAARLSGMGRAVLNVIGYKKYDSEEE